MNLIDICYSFYDNNLDSYAPVKDELLDYTCEVERHGFEAGFRFALAMIPILNGKSGNVLEDFTITTEEN